MSLNTKDLTVLNAHTKYKGNTKTAHLFHKQMLATLSKSNQKISRFIHSGVITDKNNQQLEDGTGPEATLALSNATLDLEWFIWNELVANIDHWATLQKLEKRYGPQKEGGRVSRGRLCATLDRATQRSSASLLSAVLSLRPRLSDEGAPVCLGRVGKVAHGSGRSHNIPYLGSIYVYLRT